MLRFYLYFYLTNLLAFLPIENLAEKGDIRAEYLFIVSDVWTLEKKKFGRNIR